MDNYKSKIALSGVFLAAVAALSYAGISIGSSVSDIAEERDKQMQSIIDGTWNPAPAVVKPQ